MFSILFNSTEFSPIFKDEYGATASEGKPSIFNGSFTTKRTKTLSPTFDQDESWLEENIFTDTISGGPTSILTKLSSDVVLSVKPTLPGQSVKSIANDKNPPVSISDSWIVYVAE